MIGKLVRYVKWYGVFLGIEKILKIGSKRERGRGRGGEDNPQKYNNYVYKLPSVVIVLGVYETSANRKHFRFQVAFEWRENGCCFRE